MNSKLLIFIFISFFTFKIIQSFQPPIGHTLNTMVLVDDNHDIGATIADTIATPDSTTTTPTTTTSSPYAQDPLFIQECHVSRIQLDNILLEFQQKPKEQRISSYCQTLRAETLYYPDSSKKKQQQEWDAYFCDQKFRKKNYLERVLENCHHQLSDY
jgi:hypothetical protein